MCKGRGYGLSKLLTQRREDTKKGKEGADELKIEFERRAD